MRRFVEAIERRGGSPWSPLFVAAWIAGLRIGEEHLTIYVPTGLRREPVIWFGHVLGFYLALIVCVAALVRAATGRAKSAVLAAVGAGLIVGILPPLIDVLTYGSGNFNYTYRLDFLASFPPLLYDPPKITPLGEAVAVWLSVAMVGTYVAITTGNALRTLAAVVGHYILAVCFLALLPSLAYAMHGALPSLSANETVTLVLGAATVVGALALAPKSAARIALRLPQILLAPALVFVGSALVGRVDENTLLAALILAGAALLFSAHNDYFDARHETPGTAGPVDATDAALLAAALLPSIIVAAPGHFWVSLAAVLFSIVGWTYNADPLRLKCVFPLSYKSEGFLAVLSLLAGILCHPRFLVEPRVWIEIALIGGGASVVAMLKDFKDAEADGRGGVRTIYVVLAGRGWSGPAVRRLVLGAVSVCLAVPLVYGFANGAVGLTLLAALLAVGVLVGGAVDRAPRWGLVVALTCLDAYIVVNGVILHTGRAVVDP